MLISRLDWLNKLPERIKTTAYVPIDFTPYFWQYVLRISS